MEFTLLHHRSRALQRNGMYLSSAVTNITDLLLTLLKNIDYIDPFVVLTHKSQQQLARSLGGY